MKMKFDNKVFRLWFELNGLNRSKVITEIGQRDPNKVGRWLTGQTIGTEDLIALCNTYNLQLSDFIFSVDDHDDNRIETILPEVIKLRRASGQEIVISDMGGQDVSQPSDLAMAKLALSYEQKLNALHNEHIKEMKDARANTRYQMEQRGKMVNTLQESIASLTKTIEDMRATINEQQQTISSQQNVISTYDAIIRKQKKMPPQQTSVPQTFVHGSSSVTMANDGGAVITTAPHKN